MTDPVWKAWLGSYAFDFDAAMAAHWRAHLVGKGLTGSALETACAEVEAEAGSAEIEVFDDGSIASRARGVEFFRVPLRETDAGIGFQKPDGPWVTLENAAPGLFAREPGKPTMHFRPKTLY